MSSKITKILVWDAPTRVFHWSLAVSFLGAFLTAESERLRDIHVVLGYTVFGLIAFRVIWGLIGTRYARFRSFVHGPAAVFAYVKSLLIMRPQHYIGHNPIGGWVIVALLALGLLSGVTGYATYNEIGGEWLEELHEGAANVMLNLVFLHIAGVVVSSWLHRENLVRAMVSGYKQGDTTHSIRRAHWLVGGGLLAGVFGYWTGII